MQLWWAGVTFTVPGSATAGVAYRAVPDFLGSRGSKKRDGATHRLMCGEMSLRIERIPDVEAFDRLPCAAAPIVSEPWEWAGASSVAVGTRLPDYEIEVRLKIRGMQPWTGAAQKARE